MQVFVSVNVLSVDDKTLPPGFDWLTHLESNKSPFLNPEPPPLKLTVVCRVKLKKKASITAFLVYWFVILSFVAFFTFYHSATKGRFTLCNGSETTCLFDVSVSLFLFFTERGAKNTLRENDETTGRHCMKKKKKKNSGLCSENKTHERPMVTFILPPFLCVYTRVFVTGLRLGCILSVAPRAFIQERSRLGGRTGCKGTNGWSAESNLCGGICKALCRASSCSS